MNGRDSLLYWSFPCGTLAATHVRVSVFFPLVFVVLCYRLGLTMGALFGVLLFLSVLLHEFGHVFAARATGGSADEILLWPLGGLAFVQPANRLSARLVTTAAGPLVNLTLCAATLYAVSSRGVLLDALHPFKFPIAEIGATSFWSDVLVLLFVANWLQLLLNLIPVYPLDGGQILKDTLSARAGPAGADVYLRVGFVVAFVAMFAGLMVESVWLVFVGAVVLALNIQESVQHRLTDGYDDSFMGYDFSQGYTSLERSSVDDDEPQRPRQGFLSRWREKRRARRETRQREREVAEEGRVDELLAKVQNSGMDSLTESERRFLQRASERYRERDRSQDS